MTKQKISLNEQRVNPLAYALQSNITITSLSLNEQITHVEAAYIAADLQGSRTITSLNLDQNGQTIESSGGGGGGSITAELVAETLDTHQGAEEDHATDVSGGNSAAADADVS